MSIVDASRNRAHVESGVETDPSQLPVPPLTWAAVRAFFRWNQVALGWKDDTSDDQLAAVGDIFRFPWPRMGPKMLARFPKYAAAIDIAEPGWTGEWVVLNSPSMVRELYALPPDAIDHGGTKNFLRFVMGINSPFMLDGSPHQKIRRVLVSQLTPAKVDDHREMSIEVLDRVIDSIPLNAPVRMREYYAKFAQEIIVRVVFGEEDQSEVDMMREWLDVCTQYGQRSFAPSFAMFTHLGKRSPFLEGRDEIPDEEPYRVAHRIRAEADRIIYRQMAKLRRNPNSSIASELLRLSQTDPFWTDKVIRDVIATMLMAGQDTSVNAYGWATEFLLHNTEARTTLVAEATAAQDDSYARACGNEALRLKPPVWAQMLIARRDVAVGGYRIRKGAFIWITHNVIHRNAELYPDPTEFKPERFLGGVPDQYSFIAFSAGRHRCPGRNFFAAESSMVLHRVFGRLAMEPMDPKLDRTRMEAAFFNRPHQSVPVIVRNRSRANAVQLCGSRTATAIRPADDDDETGGFES
ncbi:cytochrome P450 [Mycolicibacterium neoaurum]|uniref:cytochrome P450 n=1 Tax=Mycolicibacterium neoaurum TaxID=1795 RepID=UPI001BCD5DF3|nr:cytochrome P450 [Mycolicibacterium neoaurum]QVI27226.1 cytochrome P450 [Mycolicibacterium neoaurum]